MGRTTIPINLCILGTGLPPLGECFPFKQTQCRRWRRVHSGNKRSWHVEKDILKLVSLFLFIFHFLACVRSVPRDAIVRTVEFKSQDNEVRLALAIADVLASLFTLVFCKM